MMAGNTWNANTRPILECCLPISPNTNDDPAYENDNSHVTAAPSLLKSHCPTGMRSTKTANVSCSPSPQATTRRLMRLRLLERPKPIARMATMPNTPRSRNASDRGATTTGGAVGAGGVAAAGTVSLPWLWVVAPRSVFDTKRGGVDTATARANVTRQGDR